MSSDVKVRGKLVYTDAETLDDLLLAFDDEDEACAEVAQVVARGTRKRGTALLFSIDAHLTGDGNVELQEWLTDAAEEATEGLIDTWQEAFGSECFVRIHAGGDEQRVDAPYPKA